MEQISERLDKNNSEVFNDIKEGQVSQTSNREIHQDALEPIPNVQMAYEQSEEALMVESPVQPSRSIMKSRITMDKFAGECDHTHSTEEGQPQPQMMDVN